MEKRTAVSWIVILFWGILFIDFSYPETFRVIYIIHGDGNYLFHDEDGNAFDAAERILEQAKFVAENIKRGEVFIFYQKPTENNFLFFSKDDGEFYYYKNGLKVSEKSYSRKEAEDFEIEAGLVEEHSDITKETKNILLYYGHKIPQKNEYGYHSSYPQKEFGINVFAKGIGKLINSTSFSDKKFDLIILSTCRNGNFSTISSLSSFTVYLIASPADIHLSHLNSISLITLTKEEFIETHDLAKEFAKSSFKELSIITSTEIYISVYDIKKISESDKGELESGTTEFYRAAEFGRRN